MSEYVYIPSVASIGILDTVENPIILLDSRDMLDILRANNINNKIIMVPRFRYNSLLDLVFLPYIALRLLLGKGDVLYFGFNAHDIKFMFYVLFLKKFTDVEIRYIACDQRRRIVPHKTILNRLSSNILSVYGDFGKTTLGLSDSFLVKIKYVPAKTPDIDTFLPQDDTLMLLPGSGIDGFEYEKLTSLTRKLNPTYVKDHPTRATDGGIVSSISYFSEVLNPKILLKEVIRAKKIRKVYTFPSQAVLELANFSVEIEIINHKDFFVDNILRQRFIENTSS